MTANWVDNKLAVIEDSILNGSLRDERVCIQRYIEAIKLVNSSISSVASGTLQNNVRTQLLTLFGLRKSVKSGLDGEIDRSLSNLLEHVFRELSLPDALLLRSELLSRMPQNSSLSA